MSEHLFLLIGKNPLPNYVAAKLFVNQGTKIHFVYTEGVNGTEEYKKHIVEKLRSHFAANYFETFDIPLVDASGANHIEAAIKNHFQAEKNEQRIIQTGDSIHLNYTGGTKAMSVHVYRTIEKCADNNQLSFSYLNPRSLEMEFDDGRDSIMLNEPSKTEFEQTIVALGDLMNLHDLVYLKDERGNSQKPHQKPLFPELAEQIKDFTIDPKLRKKWLDFRYKNKKIFQEPKSTDEVAIPQELSALKTELNQISKKNGKPDYVEGCWLKFANIGSQNHIEKLVGFIFSLWIESYVLAKVNAVKDSTNLNSAGMNLSVIKSNSTNKTEPFFEVDVFAIRGYQIFAIACTVDNSKKMCKHKLFEITHRAKQLGGDEARIGLVCLADSKVKSEIEEELKEENVKVFGVNELAKLESNLEVWFRGK